MSSEIIIRTPQAEDPTRDSCAPMFTNDRSAAILEINGIIIPLSLERLNDLVAKVEEFNNTIFCYKCNHFVMSKSGWNYGGSCKFDAEKQNVIITPELAGYRFCVDCMDTCPYAISKTGDDNTHD